MKNLIFAFIIVSVIFSCKKEDATPLSKTELLSNKPWKWTAGSVSPAFVFLVMGNSLVAIIEAKCLFVIKMIFVLLRLLGNTPPMKVRPS